MSSRLFHILISSVVAVSCFITAGAEPAEPLTASNDVRIIYTNDTQGYLEPCGCGGRYEGGLARRATAFSRLLDGNRNTVIVDSGNLSDKPSKLPVLATMMSRLGYDAIGVGEADLDFAEEFFKAAAKNKLTIVDASRPPRTNVVPYVIKAIGKVRIGIVSFGANEVRAKQASGIPQRFLDAYKAARTSSDVLILLDQGGIATRKWLEEDGAKLGSPDIVIGGTAAASLGESQAVGKAYVMPTSTRGKYVGVVDLSIAHDHSIQMKHQMVLVNRDVPEDEDIKKQIEDFLLKSSVHSATSIAIRSGTYTSPEKCKDCHPDEYDDWAKSKHANATKMLVSKNRVIADCLPCHSEEYRLTGTLSGGRAANMPTGIECATCHASVLPHNDKGPVKSTVRKVDRALCLSCHNSERSPDYDTKTYLPRVSHLTAGSQ